MANGNLRELYHAELTDLYDAEQQIVQALPTLASRASSPDLKAAFEHHLERSRIHLERLDLLFNKFGLPKASRRSAAMEALIRDGERRIEAMSGSDLRDAALIAAAQHVEHYEIAGYGCARTYARQLGDGDAADLLQQTLDEEGATDKRLTDLADTINRAAAAGAESDTPARGSRLRYVAINDVQRDDRGNYADYKIRNAAGEDVGTVDGFIIDPSGRPFYLVVDAGGLFVGRRYIVPIGKAKLDPAAHVFNIGFDKDTLKRYPEFHREAFLAMSDEEARRYEWRVLEAIDPAAARKSPRAWTYDEFDYYRRPEWADRDFAAPSSTAAARASAPRDSAARPAAERERRGEPIESPDRDRDLVVASEDVIIVSDEGFDPDQPPDREMPTDWTSGSERNNRSSRRRE